MDFKVVMTKTLQQAIMSKLKTTKNFGQEIKRILEPRYIITEIKKKKKPLADGLPRKMAGEEKQSTD